MVPIMFILRGLRTDSLQETHAWHVQPIDPTRVDQTLAAPVQGTDKTIIRGHYSFLFHVPLIGGWKNFTVYEVAASDTPFHIGWVMHKEDDQIFDAKLHRLPIIDTRIRMLDGPPGVHGYFFAVNASGEQVLLRAVGHGRIGDGTYASVRLF